jgi:hypothetical protein
MKCLDKQVGASSKMLFLTYYQMYTVPSAVICVPTEFNDY